VPMTITTGFTIPLVWHAMHYPEAHPCYGPGTVCVIVIVVPDYSSTISDNGYGYLINVTIRRINETDNAPDYEYNNSWNPNYAGFIFPDGSSIRITDCSNPDLIGISWDISGHQTDSQGILHEFIPY